MPPPAPKPVPIKTSGASAPPASSQSKADTSSRESGSNQRNEEQGFSQQHSNQQAAASTSQGQQLNQEQSSDQSSQPEKGQAQRDQEKKSALARIRTGPIRIQNIEKYRPHFKKTSSLLYGAGYYLAATDWMCGIIVAICALLGLFASVTGVGLAIAAVAALIAATVDTIVLIISVLLLIMVVYGNQRISNMGNSMNAIVLELDATQQNIANRQAMLETMQQTASQAAEKLTSLKKTAAKTSGSVAGKTAAKTTIKTGAKKFLGRIIGSTLGALVPIVGLYPWQLRSIYKMRKHEKAMRQEGLALIDQTKAAINGEVRLARNHVAYLEEEAITEREENYQQKIQARQENTRSQGSKSENPSPDSKQRLPSKPDQPLPQTKSVQGQASPSHPISATKPASVPSRTITLKK